MNFIRLTEKYLDFTAFKDKPIKPEDIWIFNYLMYENKQKENQKLFEIGEKINFKGKLLKKRLLVKYETKIIIPQLKALQSANMILGNLC